jgi:hypothetical protein
MESELIKPTHLARRAVVYIRQSPTHRVVTNQESLRLQYALQRRAKEFGWREVDIDVIDSDLGLSGAWSAQRNGFKELVGRLGLNEVGLILSIDVTRLARNCSDWYPLLDVQVAGEGVLLQHLLRHHAEAVEALAHVGCGWTPHD